MRHALLVGINAYPSQPLAGCLNDVDDVAAYLEAYRGFKSEHIERLCDGHATKAAIVRALRKMIRGATPGDQLLFHFSGHGTQMPSSADDEPDGLDEVLCPVDFDWTDKTTLKDDDLRALLTEVPEEVAMTCVFDACHSGDFDRAVRPRPHVARFLVPPPEVARKVKRRHRTVGKLRSATAGHAVLVPACTSAETAADTSFDGRPNGAFSYYLLAGLRRDGNKLTVRQLMESVSDHLADYDMHPVPSGPNVKLDARFLMSEGSAHEVEPSPPWGASLQSFLNELMRIEQQFRVRHGDQPLPPHVASILEQLRALTPYPDSRNRLACRSFSWGLQIEIPRTEIDHLMARSNGTR